VWSLKSHFNIPLKVLELDKMELSLIQEQLWNAAKCANCQS